MRGGVASCAIAIALASIVGAACSAIVDADQRKLGPQPVPCDTGTSVACICPSGASSVQNCNALRRYDPCSCEQPAAGSGGTGGAAGSG